MSNRCKKNYRNSEKDKIDLEVISRLKESKRSNAKLVKISQKILSRCGKSYSATNDPVRKDISDFLLNINRKAPKICVEELGCGFSLLFCLRPWLRPVDSWVPKGKGRDSFFQSLVDHLISKYPVPKFLYKVFQYDVMLGKNSDGLLFKHLAQGGSLANVEKSILPTELTKRMRADFLKLPREVAGVVEGIRIVQIKSFNGTHSLLDAILKSIFGNQFYFDEAFFATVLQWFCNNPMLDKKHVWPLIDYISHCKRENTNFSMKGRSPLALIRGMEEWHGLLVKTKLIKHSTFTSCGLRGGKYITKAIQFGKEIKTEWSVSEILSSKELIEEGKSMRHCVYSYANSIAEGGVSIWSLRESGERKLTIEVRNNERRVVQIRGQCNRIAVPREMSVIKKWASDNNLTVV